MVCSRRQSSSNCMAKVIPEETGIPNGPGRAITLQSSSPHIHDRVANPKWLYGVDVEIQSLSENSLAKQLEIAGCQ